MSQKRVVLFTAPGCGHCVEAKNYLRNKEINFKMIDLSKDPEAARDVAKHGCRGVPVIMIGSYWICGFDKVKVNKALGIKG